MDICFFFHVQKPTKVISLLDSVISGMRVTDKLHNCIYASFMASSLILPLTFCSGLFLFMAIGFRLWKGNSKPVVFCFCFFFFCFPNWLKMSQQQGWDCAPPFAMAQIPFCWRKLILLVEPARAQLR